MVELSFTDAPLIGAGQWVGLDNYFRLCIGPAVLDRGLEHGLFRRPLGHPEHASGARHRARRQPAEGLDAEHRARGVLPALHPAGLGRLPHLGLDVRQGFRRRAVPSSRRSTAASISRSSAPFRCSCRRSPSSRSGGCSASTCCCSSRACATFRARSTKPPSSTAPAAGRQFRRITWPLIWPVTVLVLHHPAHPAAQDLRSGLSVRRTAAASTPTMVMVQYISRQAFQLNKGGLARGRVVVLFVVIVVFCPCCSFSSCAREGER